MVQKGHKKKEGGKDLGKLIHEHDAKLKGSLLWNILKQSLFAIIVGILALCLFNYMDTQVPEGVTEVWSARILDTSLRTMGKVILFLNNFGVHGGVCRFTRKGVDMMLTTLITGSPFGLGSDPELKIYDTVFDGVGVRVYEPVNLKSNKRPALVYYHGGGWSWLSVDVYDGATRALAKRVGMVVVSVSYRQSPEHPHPIPFEDCLTATKYVVNNAKSLHVDPSRVAISGDSAGGHLSAAVAMAMKKEIKISVPIYPCLQLFDLQTPSYIENKDYIPGMLTDVSMLTYWLNYGNISYNYIDDILANRHTSQKLKESLYAKYVSPDWYMKEHIRTPSLRNMKKKTNFGKTELSDKIQETILNPDFSPLMVPDAKYKDLPLTYVLTAGYDVLRDDGLIYYQRLKKAGAKVHLAHYADGFHGMIFFFDGPMPFQVGIRAMNDLVEFLKKNL
ncbi:unnamed protein product [Mytilus coruscus]|uniref:Alpha/beta hydrolase fold-3 domain-containing protein n=1 Tax=Mytilus coruscus TaxID=42192 RepID=A0A6J8CH10_MYTCO|nr:unnamed protein product [Mytilus coruscus]